MSVRHPIAFALASGFLAGNWLRRDLIGRGTAVLGSEPRWLAPLARAVVQQFPRPPHGDLPLLSTFIEHHRAFSSAFLTRERPRLARLLLDEPEMQRSRFAVPSLANHAELAKFLELESTELDWYADERGINRHARSPKLQHYHYSWQRKGQGRFRLLEAPKQHLKQLQRKILHQILDRMPAHEAAHGFVRGRSVASYVQPHVRREVVIHLDLFDFFGSVGAPRVYQVFRSAGYPDGVARALMSLCTSRVPRSMFALPEREATSPAARNDLRQLRMHLTARHLPQGAASSPALANLSCFRFDLRLNALARAVGAHYTRYADDLAISGDADTARRASTLIHLVANIAHEEGFRLNPQKTRVMTRATRQSLAGLVINEHAAVPREQRKCLEAELHHAQRSEPPESPIAPPPSPELRGKVAWIQLIHPEHGPKFERLLRAPLRTDPLAR